MSDAEQPVDVDASGAPKSEQRGAIGAFPLALFTISTLSLFGVGIRVGASRQLEAEQYELLRQQQKLGIKAPPRMPGTCSCSARAALFVG